MTEYLQKVFRTRLLMWRNTYFGAGAALMILFWVPFFWAVVYNESVFSDIALESSSKFTYAILGIIGTLLTIIGVYIFHRNNFRLLQTGETTYGVAENIDFEIAHGNIYFDVRYSVQGVSYSIRSHALSSIVMSFKEDSQIPVLYDPVNPANAFPLPEFSLNTNTPKEPTLTQSIIKSSFLYDTLYRNMFIGIVIGLLSVVHLRGYSVKDAFLGMVFITGILYILIFVGIESLKKGQFKISDHYLGVLLLLISGGCLFLFPLHFVKREITPEPVADIQPQPAQPPVVITPPPQAPPVDPAVAEIKRKLALGSWKQSHDGYDVIIEFNPSNGRYTLNHENSIHAVTQSIRGNWTLAGHQVNLVPIPADGGINNSLQLTLSDDMTTLSKSPDDAPYQHTAR